MKNIRTISVLLAMPCILLFWSCHTKDYDQRALIPAGTFLMGSSDGSNIDNLNGSGLNVTQAEPDRNINETQRWVTLSNDFYISKYPVTNAQFAVFLNDKGVQAEVGVHNPFLVPMSAVGKCAWGKNNEQPLVFCGRWTDFDWGVNWNGSQWAPATGYENHPVVWVTWYGAYEYALWAGGSLPTEAQWEYACRGGQKESLPFGIGNGRKLTGKMANFAAFHPYDLDHSAPAGHYNDAVANEHAGYTTAVGSYKNANGYGLYDMHGNVWEWCIDTWDRSPHSSAPVTDPVSPNAGFFGVLRGGSWLSDAKNSRSAYSLAYPRDNATYNFGFRVVFPADNVMQQSNDATVTAQTERPEFPFFDGTPTNADKLVMQQAEREIEKYRKGDFVITLVDANGLKIENKEFTIELERHEFMFGANFFSVSGMDDSDPIKEIARQSVIDIFNTIAVTNYWNFRQNVEHADLIKEDIRWAEVNNLRTRFHAVLYQNPKHILIGSNYTNFTVEQFWQLIEDRIKYVVEATGSKPMPYDIVNEMYIKKNHWDWFKVESFVKLMPHYPDYTDPQVIKRIFDLTRKYLPDAQLVGLEAGDPSINDRPYMNIIDYWKRCLEAGADIDIIGTQAHFFAKGGVPFQQNSYYNMSEVSMALDTLRTLGKPIEITEFNGPTRNSGDSPQSRAHYWSMTDEENSAWQINFYRLAFSKPHIIGLTRWFLIDNVCGRGMDAGIITQNGEKRRIYYDLKKLIKEEWHTRIDEKTNNAGTLAFRGFYGDYVLNVDGYKPANVTLNSDSDKNITIVLNN